MRRVIVNCAPVKDESGRTIEPTKRYMDLTSQEQTAYDDLQTRSATGRTAESAAAQQRIDDMEAIRQRAVRGDTEFASLYRLLGGRGLTS